MIQLIVEKEDGTQAVISIDKSGEYFDPQKVLWDERTDGPIPDGMIENLGGLCRQGKNLVVDNVALTEAQAAKQAAIDLENQRLAEIASAKKVVQNASISEMSTLSELIPVVKSMAVLLNDA